MRAAHAWAEDGGGVVLLSPAAASFDRYADYRARGAAFAAVVRQLTGKGEETLPRQGSAP